ncbi:MAG: Gfo/Idh/MocA family protein [Planctomycetota bacterium]|jgi:predicted dehydrogenase
MDVVRIGIVGIGGMGSHHAKYLIKDEVPGAKLTAVCDTDPKRLEWAAKELPEGVKRFGDSNALIDSGEVDAVMIATPHYDHPPIAIAAFARGLHVLSEKPARVYTKQVREMNEAAGKSGKVFALMFNQRTTAAYRKLKEIFEAGDLGELRRTNWLITGWYRSQSYYDSGGWRASWAGEGGGVLLNQCPHNLDLWQWTCGMPKRVRAFCYFGKYHDIEVEDDVTAYVEYENGATGLFITTTGEHPGTNRLEVNGDKGKVVVEGGKLTFWRNRVPVSQFNREFKGGFGSPESWKCDVPVRGGGGGHAEVTRGFVAAIREGKPLLTPGEDGIRSLSLSNAMLLSAWTDSWVDIPFDDDLFHEKIKEKIAASTYKKPDAGGTMDVDGTF